jgi:hypothetical protein
VVLNASRPEARDQWATLRRACDDAGLLETDFGTIEGPSDATLTTCRRPPQAEVATLWSGAHPVSAAVDAVKWLRGRGLDPERVHALDLARVLPAATRLPAWARFGAHPLVLLMFAVTGEMESLHARSINTHTSPKALSPAGFQIRGLVMANAVARAALLNRPPQRVAVEPLEVWVTEGVPDFLTLSTRSDNPANRAVLGIVAAMLVLAVCATAVAKRVKVKLGGNWVEPLNLFVVVVLPPGARKSAVLERVKEPLERFEHDEAARLGPEHREAKVNFEVTQARLEKLKTAAVKAKTAEDRAVAIAEATSVANDLAEMKVIEIPRLLTDDCTQERLASLMCAHDGRIAQLSPEGGVFEMMAGRYSTSGSTNFDIYLKGHAGDTIRVDRINRAAEFIEQPALTLGLAIQPETLKAAHHRSPKLQGLKQRGSGSGQPASAQTNKTRFRRDLFRKGVRTVAVFICARFDT